VAIPGNAALKNDQRFFVARRMTFKRTAISWRRCVARASSNDTIFVQAMSNNSDTEPKRIQRDWRTPPTVTSLSGSTRQLFSRLGHHSH